MSVRKMAEVWERSQHAGSALLMLLAIADFADDDGRAYPSVASLARKCRMKPRNAQTLLATLRDSGELVIRNGEGPKGTNLYRIPPLQHLAPLQGIAPMQDSAPLQRSAPGGAKPCAYPLQGIAPKPSVNHQEPSTLRSAKRNDPEEGFAEFWSAYPKKVSKQDALKAWRKLRPDENLRAEIAQAVTRQSGSEQWQREGGKFIPYPASWLNGRRWEDEMPAAGHRAITHADIGVPLAN